MANQDITTPCLMTIQVLLLLLAVGFLLTPSCTYCHGFLPTKLSIHHHKKTSTTESTVGVETGAVMTSSAGSHDVDDDTMEFHKLASSAVDLSSGIVVGNQQDDQVYLSIERSVRCWDESKRQSYLYRIPLHGGGGVVKSSFVLPPTPLDTGSIFLPSPSGRKTVMIKNKKSNNDGGKPTTISTANIEIWKGGSRVSLHEIPSSCHGKIINDEKGFGVPVWSPDESWVMYVAERTRPKTSPFWSSPSLDGDNSQRVKQGQQFVVDDDAGTQEGWGERYADQAPILDLYILNIVTGRLGRVNILLPDNKGIDIFTVGQPQWHPTEPNKVAFTVWDASGPKRLGMVYCMNRKSAIYEADITSHLEHLARTSDDGHVALSEDAPCKCLSKDLYFARSPRYCLSEEQNEKAIAAKAILVFLASDREFVSHDACIGLYRWDEESSVSKQVVPVVDTPWKIGGMVKSMGFPGLFLGQLPNDCRLSSNYVYMTSIWGSFQRIVRINVVSNDVSLVNVTNVSDDSSQSVVAWTPKGDMIFQETSFGQPNRLWLIHRSELTRDRTGTENSPINVSSEMIMSFPPIAASKFAAVDHREEIAPFDIKTISAIPQPIDDEDSASTEPIQALLLLPHNSKRKNGKLPVVVVPHGGPHSCSVSAYTPGVAYLASKYAVLLPNYRGSTGFGQAALDSLLTRIGAVDVQDVITLLDNSLEEFPEDLDRHRVGICGGSHGGFLTAHCTSQYENLFKAAAMRNPVTNIASMITSTDIPDWCMAECMGLYDASTFKGPTFAQLEAMYSKSPVSRVDRVKSPTLIAIGMSDLRVPPSQGLEWFHSLRSSGVPTKLLRYPNDNHALDTVTTEADHWIHIRKWFDNYL